MVIHDRKRAPVGMAIHYSQLGCVGMAIHSVMSAWRYGRDGMGVRTVGMAIPLDGMAIRNVGMAIHPYVVTC